MCWLYWGKIYSKFQKCVWNLNEWLREHMCWGIIPSLVQRQVVVCRVYQFQLHEPVWCNVHRPQFSQVVLVNNLATMTVWQNKGKDIPLSTSTVHPVSRAELRAVALWPLASSRAEERVYGFVSKMLRTALCAVSVSGATLFRSTFVVKAKVGIGGPEMALVPRAAFNGAQIVRSPVS